MKFWKTCTLVLVAPLAISLGAAAAVAQCTQQPPQNLRSFPPNTVVYYQFDPNANFPQATGQTTPQQQIQNAFSAWSSANSQPGGDGITFVAADSQHPATVTITTDTSVGTQAAITSSRTGVLSASNPATMTFFLNAASSTGTPAFDPSQAGFGTAFLQDTLHEIGHLQGIGDYNPPNSAPAPGPNSSVMIGHIGTNDIGNTSPKTGPTPCDVQQAATTSAALAGSNASNGGGSGGSGGSGDSYDNEGSGYTSDPTDSDSGSYTDPSSGITFTYTSETVTVSAPTGSYDADGNFIPDGGSIPIETITYTNWTYTENGVVYTVTDAVTTQIDSSDGSSGSGGSGSSGGSGNSSGSGSGGGSGGGPGSGWTPYDYGLCDLYWNPCWCNN